MSYRWIGAVLVLLSCGGFGFSTAAAFHAQVRTLRQLRRLLDLAEAELSYRLTPLPELCRILTRSCTGVLAEVFSGLAQELEQQVLPDVPSCMRCVLSRKNLQGKLRRLLTGLGDSLGQFDLPGQLKHLASVREECTRQLALLEENRDERTRSYRTLGLCAGAALVILFI